MKDITQQGEISYNLTDASVSDLSSWLQEVDSGTHKTVQIRKTTVRLKQTVQRT